MQRKVCLSVPSENVKHLTCISKQCSAHLVEELDCIMAESKNGKVLMNLVGTRRYYRGTVYSLLDNMVKN